MARIVITTFGSYGDVFPYIGLALGLRARGHQPRLAMPALYKDLIEGEGSTFIRFDPSSIRTIAGWRRASWIRCVAATRFSASC